MKWERTNWSIPQVRRSDAHSSKGLWDPRSTAMRALRNMLRAPRGGLSGQNRVASGLQRQNPLLDFRLGRNAARVDDVLVDHDGWGRHHAIGHHLAGLGDLLDAHVDAGQRHELADQLLGPDAVAATLAEDLDG